MKGESPRWPAAENGAVVSCSCCYRVARSSWNGYPSVIWCRLRDRVAGGLQTEAGADDVQHLVRPREQGIGTIRVVDDVVREPDLFFERHLCAHAGQHVSFIASVTRDRPLDSSRDRGIH